MKAIQKPLVWSGLIIISLAVVWGAYEIWFEHAQKPTITSTDSVDGFEFVVRHVRNRPVTDVEVISVERTTILCKVRAFGGSSHALETPRIRYGSIPQGFEQEIPRIPPAATSREPSPLRDGELLIASVRYIDDHGFAPGAGDDAKMFRKTRTGLKLVEMNHDLVASLRLHIKWSQPSNYSHHSLSVDEVRQKVAEDIIQMAHAFRSQGKAHEADKWLEFVQQTYPETQAAAATKQAPK